MNDRKGPFGSCMDFVPKQSFMRTCSLDVCAVNENRKRELACTYIQMMANECAEKGRTVGEWRAIMGCGKF